MGDWNLYDFKRDADSIISRRYISTHATTTEELDVMVEEARKLLQGSGLTGKVTPEIKVLNNYEIIKKHLPPSKYQGQTVAGGELDDSAQQDVRKMKQLTERTKTFINCIIIWYGHFNRSITRADYN